MRARADSLSTEAEGPLDWSTNMKIPFALLDELLAPRDGEPSPPERAATWRVGLFKCADDTSQPHWGSAFDIGDELNFHQPELFGSLELE